MAEVLFICSMVMVVASLAVPALLEWRHLERTRYAYFELRVLMAAAIQFNREYRQWPVPGKNDSDVRYGQQLPNASVFNILRGTEPSDSGQPLSNPQRIDFFQMTGSRANDFWRGKDGQLLDPWGRPYQLAFDSNYDGICSLEDSPFGLVAGEGVAVWSGGRDRRPDTEDDLRSWAR